MTIKYFTLFLLIISFYATSICQDQLYRNEENNFRIKFPKGWQIKDGDGPNAIKKAVNEGSSILILVKDLITKENIELVKKEAQEYSNYSDAEIVELMRNEWDYKNFNDAEILNMVEAQIQELGQKFEDVKLLEKDIRYLDNKKFLFIKYKMASRVQKLKITMIGISFGTFYDGKYYQVSGSSEQSKFNIIEPALIRSISTFVFEDYGRYTSDKQYEIDDEGTIKESNKTENKTSLLILTFFIILLIGPAIAVLIRFLVMSEAMEKKKSILIAVVISIVTVFLWIYINKEANLFLLLLLLTILLNYKILNYSGKIRLEIKTDAGEQEVEGQPNDDNTIQEELKKEFEFDLTKYVEIDDSELNDIEREKIFAKILRLNGKISKKDITMLYRALIEKYHPDKVSHLGIEFQVFANKKTKDINKAYSYFKKKYNIK